MSKIEWTTATINPFVGCTPVSPGCDHCYAVKMAHRKSGVRKTPYYKGTTSNIDGVAWTGQINKAPNNIFDAILRRIIATTYFVCSMSDYFHKNAKDAWREEVLDVAEKMSAAYISNSHPSGHRTSCRFLSGPVLHFLSMFGLVRRWRTKKL